MSGTKEKRDGEIEITEGTVYSYESHRSAAPGLEAHPSSPLDGSTANNCHAALLNPVTPEHKRMGAKLANGTEAHPIST